MGYLGLFSIEDHFGVIDSPLVPKWPVSLKKQLAVVQQLGVMNSCGMYMGYLSLWPFGVPCHFGALCWTCFRMVCNLKMAGYSKTGWNLGVGSSCNMYMRYLWSFSVQGHFWDIWHLFGAVVSKWPGFWCQIMWQKSTFRNFSMVVNGEADTLNIWKTVDLVVKQMNVNKPAPLQQNTSHQQHCH